MKSVIFRLDFLVVQWTLRSGSTDNGWEFGGGLRWAAMVALVLQFFNRFFGSARLHLIVLLAITSVLLQSVVRFLWNMQQARFVHVFGFKLGQFQKLIKELWFLVVPVLSFIPWWNHITFAFSTFTVISMKDERFVVLDKVTFHLRKEYFECNELSLLPLDELGDVKLSANAVLSLGQSVLVLLLHAPSSATEIAY